ncbi:hypothetical protein [Kitasatospora herbaricolor]
MGAETDWFAWTAVIVGLLLFAGVACIAVYALAFLAKRLFGGG